MSEFYQKSYQIELLTEFSSGVYSEIYNLVEKQKLEETHVLVKILAQLREIKRTNLFTKSIAELENLKQYWQAMNNYVQQLEGL